MGLIVFGIFTGVSRGPFGLRTGFFGAFFTAFLVTFFVAFFAAAGFFLAAFFFAMIERLLRNV